MSQPNGGSFPTNMGTLILRFPFKPSPTRMSLKTNPHTRQQMQRNGMDSTQQAPKIGSQGLHRSPKCRALQNGVVSLMASFWHNPKAFHLFFKQNTLFSQKASLLRIAEWTPPIFNIWILPFYAYHPPKCYPQKARHPFHTQSAAAIASATAASSSSTRTSRPATVNWLPGSKRASFQLTVCQCVKVSWSPNSKVATSKRGVAA